MRSLIVLLTIIILGDTSLLSEGVTSWIFWIFFSMDIINWFFRKGSSFNINFNFYQQQDDSDNSSVTNKDQS